MQLEGGECLDVITTSCQFSYLKLVTKSFRGEIVFLLI